ncbi:MAG TPA: hypothetical protein VJN18_29875 [Polyangiaceae bacterium]|nr:hypothetical protein [Polyangiaceae bacterium]
MRDVAAAVALTLSVGWLGSSCTPLKDANDLNGQVTAGKQASSGASSGSASSGGAGNAGSGDAEAGANQTSGGDQGDGGADPAGCPPPEQRGVELLAESGELTLETDTAWTCQRDYRVAGNVIVAPGAALAILPGTRVLFDERTLLLAQRGARLIADGTATEPIVLTSSKEPGSRAPGDYRGVILIGDGPSHSSTVPVYGSLNDSRAHFGGGQAGDPSGSCGSLRYVRVEFAGGSVDDQSLPGAALTLAGCGSATVVDYVQVHRGKDGIGLLGGTAPLRHVLVTNNLLGQAIEWTGGYTGTLQFVVAQSLAASSAMQGSNSVQDPEAAPVSRPTIYNATLVGSAPPVTGQHYGLSLQFGSRAIFKNSIVQGFADAGFDLRLPAGVLKNEVGAGKAVDISHALMSANGAAYSVDAQVLAGMESMRMQDPGLPQAALPNLEMPEAIPRFAPTDPTVNTQPAPVPAGFDATAGFRGAVPQDGIDWTLGWTSYPND